MTTSRAPLDVDRLYDRDRRRRWVGREVQVVEATGSTNDLCHERATDPEAIGLAIFAESQASGRGQQGRVWSAPARSSLLVSLLIDPPAELASPSFLTAWAAVTIADVLAKEWMIDAYIKWPNDILVEGYKLAGILIESRRATVVGIGINVSVRTAEFPAELRLPAMSIEDIAGRPVDRTTLARQLLDGLDHWYGTAIVDGPASIWREWSRYAEDLVGKQVRVVARRETRIGTLRAWSPATGVRLSSDGGGERTIRPEDLLRVERRHSPTS